MSLVHKFLTELKILFFILQNTLVITLQFYRLIVVHAEKRKGFKSSKKGEGKSQRLCGNAVKKRGTSPGSGAGGFDSTRNLRGAKVVKVTPAASSVSGIRGTKPPKRVVAKLVRTASEDDGAAVYPSPAHSATFLIRAENDMSWRQYSRVGYLHLPLLCFLMIKSSSKC